MKFLIPLLLLISISANAQFGFERIDTVEVIKNSIVQKYPWAGGLDYAQFSNIDLNGDGIEDLFIFDRTCHKVLTFLHNGGTGVIDYTYAPEYEELFPDMRNWALLVDYDCDGDKDIYTYTIGGARVYKNTSTGSGLEFTIAKSILRTNTYGNEVYMYISSVDIPAITDIDGDGDMDILAFGVGGVSLEYQRNMSIENYGVCDSLEYVTGNICWGLFKESATTNLILLNEPCTGQVSNPYNVDRPEDNQDRHAGSTVLALDMDADNVMDLVLGDISYPSLTLLMNGGAAPNTNSAMVSQDNAFPSNTVSTDLPIYPAGFYADIDNDGIRDLLVSPASTIGSENEESVWMYKNSGADNNPTFNYQQNNFLQGDMIDFGSGAYPVYFDHNGDGLKDLLVSIQGKYDNGSGNQKSKIAYYENTGTALTPQFTLITDDYQNISTMGISTNLNFYPTFGDLDGDGDEDLILGEYTGYCYYFENTGGAGNNAIFGTYSILEETDGTVIIDGIYPIPQLVDIDRDGDLDMVLGKRNGKLNYYKNIGNSSTYEFKLFTTELGGVNVTEYGFVEGRAVPVFVDIENEYHLIIGSKNGYLHYYDDIDDNIEANFNLVDSTLEDINIGTQSAPAVFDITGDNKLEMMVGNKRGGLAMYKSAFVTEVGLLENNFDFSIYPNPASSAVTIKLSYINAKQSNSTFVTLTDVTGRQVLSQSIQTTSTVINTEHLSKGIYVVQLNIEGKIYTQKLIIQ